MRRVLIKSNNLIGDSLYVSCAMKAYLEKYPDTEFTLITAENHITPLYRQFDLPITVETSIFPDKERIFDEAFDLGAGAGGVLADKVLHEEGKSFHLAQSFGRMMGVDVNDIRPTYRPISPYTQAGNECPDGVIFLSPFSMSCTSQDLRKPGMPPNKMLPWQTWSIMLRFLRTLGSPIKVLGAKENRAPLPISEDEYYTGIPLNDVALSLQKCRMLITVDNGMHHLAATLLRPIVLYYPSVLPITFMGSTYNPNSVIIHMNPAKTPATQLFVWGKQAIQRILEKEGD